MIFEFLMLRKYEKMMELIVIKLAEHTNITSKFIITKHPRTKHYDRFKI